MRDVGTTRAVVTFGSARAAGRRIAGVTAAGRIVRELAEAGLREAALVLPPGERLDAAAMDDIRRLAGTMTIGEAAPTGSPDGGVLHLAGDRLVPASALRGLPANGALPAGTIRLDASGASAEILRGTGKAGDGPVSRWLNRPVSRLLSRLLLHVPGFRPIYATIGTIILAVLMFAALLEGSARGLVAGGLLFQAASVFDGVDGEVARATFRTSPAGAVLDTIVDIVTNVLFILGVTLHLGLGGNEWAFALTGWALMLFALGLAAIAWRASHTDSAFTLDTVKHHYRGRFAGRFATRLMEFLTIVTSRDFFALLFALLILAGVPMAVLGIFAAAASIWIFFVLGALRGLGVPSLAPREI